MEIKRSLQRIGYFICGLILVGGILNARVSEAATFHVATTGNDSNPGTQASPWRTLQKGVNTMAPGDTLLVRAGSYAGFRLINTGGGTPGKPKTIKPFTGEIVTLDRYLTPASGGLNPIIYFEGAGASYVTLDGFRFTDTEIRPHPGYGVPWTPGGGTNNTICNQWGLYGAGQNAIRFDWNSSEMDLPHHITVQNSEIFGMYSAGLWGPVNDLQLLNNIIRDNGKAEPRYPRWYVFGYGTYIEGNNHLVRGNTVYGNASVGLRFACQGGAACPLTNSIIENNLIYNNYGRLAHGNGGACDSDTGGYGIVVFGGTGNIIRNNVIYGNAVNENWGDRMGGNWGIYLHPWSRTNAGPNLIYNNTVYNHNSVYNPVGITVLPEGQWGAFGGNVVRNNISYLNGTALDVGAGNTQSNNLTSDPKFVKASAGDFHLQAGSAAIDAGVVLSEVSVDYSGVARPQGGGYDIGAYEYMLGGLVPPSNLRIAGQ